MSEQSSHKLRHHSKSVLSAEEAEYLHRLLPYPWLYQSQGNHVPRPRLLNIETDPWQALLFLYESQVSAPYHRA